MIDKILIIIYIHKVSQATSSYLTRKFQVQILIIKITKNYKNLNRKIREKEDNIRARHTVINRRLKKQFLWIKIPSYFNTMTRF